MAQNRHLRLLSSIDIVASVMMIAASASLLWFTVRLYKSAPGEPAEPISLQNASIKGSRQAKTVVIEYADFECPFCLDFARNTLPEVNERYISTGLIQLVFRHLPLPRHTGALDAAKAAECAGRQGRFWTMHDLLFAEPLGPNTPSPVQRAKTVGLDLAQFDSCLTGEAVDRLRADVAEAQRLGVRGTPTFIFGTLRPDGRISVARTHVGAMSISTFDRLVKEVTTARSL